MKIALILLAISMAAATHAALATATAGAFPRDAASLRALDDRQLRIVRRASSLCWHSGQGGFGSRGVVARACVMNTTESALAREKDPALKAFHDVLPMHVRYNEYRPAFYWQRLVHTPQ